MKKISSFTYSKPDSSVEPISHTPLHEIAESIGSQLNIQPVAGYSKPEEFEQPKSLVVVFSGGTTRERNYFNILLSHKELFPNLRFEFYAEDKFGKDDFPLVFSMAEQKVMEFKESANVDSPDSYFVVTDVDHFRRHIVAFKPVCDSNGINLIVSNPCIEVWLYYSMRSDRFDGFVMPSNPLELSDSVKRFVHDKTDGVNPKHAIFDIDTNINNSVANYSEDRDGLPSLFSTNMHRLAIVLKPNIEDGLHILSENLKRTKMEHLIANNRSNSISPLE